MVGNKMREVESARDQQGQSLLEMALILPTLLLIFAGLVDVGRAYQAYISITGAAREGARYAELYPNDTNGIKNKVLSTAINVGITTSNVNVTCSPCTSGNTLQVSVSFTFQP